MINFQVDRSSSVPAYAQLIRQVREALRMGVLTPGDQLPTVRSVVTSQNRDGSWPAFIGDESEGS